MAWAYAGDVRGEEEPTILSMLGWPGRQYGHYRAGNAFEHWITEMMLTGKEPCNAERLLLPTEITLFNMHSNWENGVCSEVGRRVETPHLDMTYRTTYGPMFNSDSGPPIAG